MSKKTALLAFAAGTTAGILISRLSLAIPMVPARKVAPGTPADSVVPAPTASQRVPRPGRPRPQMKTAGAKRPAKRVK